ncbi:MAG TPA: SDR family oxidoreductase, partial [Allosphingosinicella sp.]|nr:SDR family oxidoreductase [Allosphingosinicella sp.]
PIWEGLPAFNELVERGGKDSAFKAMAAGTPLARFGKPEEIAAQIAFLLSDEAAFMTGACLVSDGGYTL